jgi:IclR family pca regulon transcriptional regulator
MKARELPRLTVHTIVDAKKFRAAIAEVRNRDWACASEEHELGVHALAVPLRNMQGQTVAALNVVAPPQRVSARTMESALLPVLLDAARELRPLL